MTTQTTRKARAPYSSAKAAKQLQAWYDAGGWREVELAAETVRVANRRLVRSLRVTPETLDEPVTF